MTGPASSSIAWRKSTFSNNGGDCVEVAALDSGAWRKSRFSNGTGGECVEVTGAGPVIAVRDSKDPRGPHLDFSPGDWRGFVTGLKVRAKNGESGLPA